MRKILLVIFLIISSFAFFIPNYALGQAMYETQEELRLYVGEVKIISVNHPRRIAIGNPNIADIANVTMYEITLSPKSVGTTTLVIWDNFGEQSYQVRVVAEDMQEIKRRVDSILTTLSLPGVYTKAADEEGKVMLLGNVKTAQDRERINIALGTLKEKIVDLLVIKEEEAVIEIDVQVLELSKDATQILGFTWPSSTTTAPLQTITEVTPASSIATKFSTLFVVEKFTRTAFTWKIDALAQEGKARVLSRPRLACQSGKEAELLVGGEKPIFATYTTQTATGATVEYKEYGIKLKIKPTITEENRIKLALNMQVSDVGEADTIGTATETRAKAYPLTKRTASTELFLNNGQTLAIGGLMKQKTEEDVAKTPGLGDVPIIGLFFRKKSTKIGGGAGTRGDTELFITLTPTIISKKEEVAEAKKELRPQITTSLIEENSVEPVAAYSRLVQKRILENLNYPRPAKEAGFQGIVKLSLRLSYVGELLDVGIKDSSGYQILDDNAVSAAKNISAYPPFPSSIEQKELWIDVPVIYRLD